LAVGAGTGISVAADSISATLGVAIDSTEITDDVVSADDLAAALTFADGDFLNLSSINASSTTEGLRLPQATVVTSSTAEGQIAWDTDNDILYVGDGSSVVAITNPFGAAIDSSEITNGTVANADLADDTIDFDKITDASALDAAWSLTGTAGETVTVARTLTDATAENALTVSVVASDAGSSTTSQLDSMSTTLRLPKRLMPPLCLITPTPTMLWAPRLRLWTQVGDSPRL
jgi:hypothetical protein